jgi:inactivated superfamily I helicase
MFTLFSELNRLDGLVAELRAGLGAETLWKLLIEIMEKVKIPFTGEPLKGLQVMGLLETRSLDFENVYILSMNEGTVPRSGSNGSYIPYHLRKAFRIPTYEDDDASFAYYFYRLIQRAKNINLIYNTETSGLLSGERTGL